MQLSWDQELGHVNSLGRAFFILCLFVGACTYSIRSMGRPKLTYLVHNFGFILIINYKIILPFQKKSSHIWSLKENDTSIYQTMKRKMEYQEFTLAFPSPKNLLHVFIGFLSVRKKKTKCPKNSIHFFLKKKDGELSFFSHWLLFSIACPTHIYLHVLYSLMVSEI